jgi:peptidoglycan/LPS O-acetylase OafA/YrhL
VVDQETRSTRAEPAEVQPRHVHHDALDGLRAVGVLLVMVERLRAFAFPSSRLLPPGGYIGVDVFFVLSGFLITRLLVKELATTGTLALPNFWARRARRLLPASVLVLVATLVAGRWMLAPLDQRTLAGDATAAGGFVVNFVFAHRSSDYFDSQTAHSPLLHFWSLAVEEQFYLLWPLVLVALARRPRQYRRLLVAVILAAGVTSIVASVWLTDHYQKVAFYLLPARMGELLAGAAIATAGVAFSAVNASYRAALGWLGVVGIGVAVLTFEADAGFPGTQAMLPVLGTVLVLVAGGAGTATFGPARALRHPVGQWIGRHSYAIYLWHWPVLVLCEAQFGPLVLPVRFAVIVLSVGLAAISLRLVEDPVRHARWLAADPRRGLALGAALCAAALGAASIAKVSVPQLDSGTVATAPTLPTAGQPAPTSTVAVTPASGSAVVSVAAVTTVPATLGPLEQGDLAALVAANRTVLEQGLTVTDVPSNLRPSLGAVSSDRAQVYADGCVAVLRQTELIPCRYGDETAAVTIVLYGDSHAAQWSPALIAIAESRGYDLIVLAKGGCPVSAVSIPNANSCPTWRDKAIEFIAAERPDVVVVSQLSDYPSSDEEWSSGLSTTLQRLRPLAANVVVLGDNPPARVEPASCLSDHLRDADSCVAERDDVVMAGRVSVERSVAGQLDVSFVDTTDWLCTDTACPVIIGDILLYRDVTHITTAAAEWFGPLVEASLAPLLR